MGDGDDDQQVESHSEQRDEGQHSVNQHSFSVWALWLPAGGVKELWKAKFTFFQGRHHQRKTMQGEATELWQLCDQTSLSYS